MKKKWFRIVMIAVMISLMSQTMVAFAAEKETQGQFVKFVYVPDDVYTDDDMVSGSWEVSGDAEVTYGKITITYNDNLFLCLEVDVEYTDALKGMTVHVKSPNDSGGRKGKIEIEFSSETPRRLKGALVDLWFDCKKPLKKGQKISVDLKVNQLKNGTKDVLSKVRTKSTKVKVDDEQEILQKGYVYMKGNAFYKITKISNTAREAVFVEKLRNSGSSVDIPAHVILGGLKFKVTGIADNALKNNTEIERVSIGSNVTKIGKGAFCGAKRLKSITIKSTGLKKIGKNALKGVHRKCKIKVPKKKLKEYKTYLKNKGQKSSVKIVVSV